MEYLTMYEYAALWQQYPNASIQDLVNYKKVLKKNNPAFWERHFANPFGKDQEQTNGSEELALALSEAFEKELEKLFK